jgi:hypothetical protein
MKAEGDLYERVMRELDWSPRMRSRGVSIVEKNNTVVLTGEVENESERWAFDLAAQRALHGIRVVNQLTIAVPTEAATTDAEFRKRMRQ